MADRIQTYEEFWPFYLREHAQPKTRWIHFVGTHLGLALGAIAIWRGSALWVLGALACAYGFAWFSHFMIEKNRPATFKYPLWSLISDFRMAAFMWSGRLSEELKKANAQVSGAAR